jgi:hypothetical protein
VSIPIVAEAADAEAAKEMKEGEAEACAIIDGTTQQVVEDEDAHPQAER